MFLTLCYAFLTVVVQRQRRRVYDLIKDRVVCGTVSFHKSISSFNSSFCDGEISSSNVLLQKNDNKLTFILPKQKVNIFSWTSFHNATCVESPKNYSAANSVNILLETCFPSDPSSKACCLSVEEYCVPMAWRHDEMFGILVKSSMEDFSLLGAAFLNDQLCMNEGMEIHKMMTVDVEGSPVGAVDPSSFPLSPSSSWSSYILQSDSTISTPIVDQTPELCEKLLVEGGADSTEDDLLGNHTFPCLEPMINNEFCDTYGGSNESLAENVLSLLNESLSNSEGSLNDGEDSLCSQGSNEGEAASQASSPRKLIDSIYCNLRNSVDEFEEGEEYCAGEAMAEGLFSPIPDDGEMLFIANGESDSSVEHNGNGVPPKPPNILVYTGEEKTSSCHWFQNIKENLQMCLNPDCYTIYLLPPSQVHSAPWKDNTELLIVSCEKVTKEISECFSAFVNSGGKLLNFCSDLELFSCDKLKEIQHTENCVVSLKYKDEDPIFVMQGKYRNIKELPKGQNIILGRNSDGNPLINVFHMEHSSSMAIACQVHLEVDPVFLSSDEHVFLNLKQNNAGRLSILRDILSVHLLLNCKSTSQHQLTPCYLFVKEKARLDEFMDVLRSKVSNNKIRSSGTTLEFTETENGIAASKDTLPVIYNSSSDVPFNVETYYSNLKTSNLGRTLLYIDVVPTTMTVLTGLTDIEGTIAISRYQTEGKGRGGNKWLSPEGCASFTLHVTINLNSNLGQKLSFLQHLTSLAMVEAIKGKEGYENIDIKLKWPNDIYYKNKIKLGGILLNSTLLGGIVHCFVGCGININNSLPTTCVNDIIKLHNRNTGDNLPCLSVEEYIGRTVTELEIIIQKFEKGGHASLLEKYYSYWLHSGQKVTLHENGTEVEIMGLDDYGYLQVQTSAGNVMSLQGDGNSLDMMRNLIILKS